MVKIVGIIQARISSTRLPAKVMLNIDGKTLLERVIERVKVSKLLHELYIATSTNSEDDLIEEIALKNNTKCYRGNLENVFERFVEVVNLSNADIVVRITADNPLTEAKLIDYGVNFIIENNFDYIGYKNTPIGSAVEIFSAKSFLEILTQNNLSLHNKEHVTSYYYQNPHRYSVYFIEDFYKENLSDISITVDTLEDYIKVYKIYNEFNIPVSDILDAYITHVRKEKN
ncbi:cytidylyltransferase domain-containing protein [Lysinibacillus endophyticus]|uniref:cytidylyltransferase domain-containing protein n=1 Tax=Ureibacillus endophyticus TaxID=1978490 RepID=UPI00209FF74A|nr:hypothetical protein [Lysinibacillus endophyticus]MCP1143746.1 hypothetical protein [Lysinibacillus endophyticus]